MINLVWRMSGIKVRDYKVLRQRIKLIIENLTLGCLILYLQKIVLVVL